MAIDFLKIKREDLPFRQAVALGRIPYADTIYKEGQNRLVGAVDFHDVWQRSVNEILLSSAETMDVVSSSSEDAPSQTGVSRVLIQGLDNNYNVISENITLDGTTPVTTTLSFLRVYRVYATAVGSANGNVGLITITATTAGTDHGRFEVGENQTRKSQFTIPAGFYGFLTSVSNRAARGLVDTQYTLEFRMQEMGGAFRSLFITEAFEGVQKFDFTFPLIIPPKADIKLSALNRGSSVLAIIGSYELILIKEEFYNAEKLRIMSQL